MRGEQPLVAVVHGPAYGAQKAGVDKLAADMAVDLREHGVGTVSIWMGLLATERTRAAAILRPDQYGRALEIAETPEFTGHLIAAVHRDPEYMTLSGQTFIGAELADRYGITDASGRKPMSHRASFGGPRMQHPAIVQ
jgi:NAD(P)-dependent dehydrogenase (short-subunit alcohol dehydrogenase family)